MLTGKVPFLIELAVYVIVAAYAIYQHRKLVREVAAASQKQAAAAESSAPETPRAS